MYDKQYSTVIYSGRKGVGFDPPGRLYVNDKQNVSFICQNIRSATDEAVQYH